MNISYIFPDCFVPEEKEFQIYCAIKLLENNYISIGEAKKICGYIDFDENKFIELCHNFKKRYKKICGRAYTDWEYEEDPKER